MINRLTLAIASTTFGYLFNSSFHQPTTLSVLSTVLMFGVTLYLTFKD